MDKEKIQRMIHQMQEAVGDPATPADMKETIGVALEKAKRELAEHESDPHGQKRLVDDCHGLLLEIRDAIGEMRQMTIGAMEPRILRATAEHGILINTTELPNAGDQKFEDDFLVFEYKTRFFNDYPLSVSLFNKLLQQTDAFRHKSLLMWVAKDMDHVMEMAVLAKTEGITEEQLRQAIIGAMRGVYFLQPLVMGLTGPEEDINSFFPIFLVDAVMDIATNNRGAKLKFGQGGRLHAQSVKEAKETTVFVIDQDGDIKETTLYDHVMRSVDETTIPHGVGPRTFVEKEVITEFNYDTEQDEEKEGWAVKTWGVGGRGPAEVIATFETEEEAEDYWYTGIYNYDFQEDDQRDTSYFLTKAEAERHIAEMYPNPDDEEDDEYKTGGKIKEYGPADLPKDGSPINVYVPPIGTRKRRYFVLTYDQDNFRFNITEYEAPMGSVGEKELLNLLNQGSYKLRKPEKPVKVNWPKGKPLPENFVEFLEEKGYGRQWYKSDRPIKRRDEMGHPRINNKTYKTLEKEYEKLTGKKYKTGGKVHFGDKVESIAKSLEGKSVPKKYQKTEGKRFSKKTAHQAARRIAGAMVKKEKGKPAGKVRKMLLGGVMIHSPGNMSLMNTDNLDIHSVGGASVV